jgi:ABC-type uncharacterized transport system ATPase subunit
MLYAILRALAKDASVLAFDEPDNFVATEEIQPWLAELRRAAAEDGQGTLLVASHHPEVIDYLAADQTVVFSRKPDGPVRIDPLGLSQEAMEEGLSASDHLRLRGDDDC